MSEFRDSAPSAPAVFYRSYSRRKPDGTRESFAEAISRTVGDLADIGSFTDEQRELCLDVALKQHAFPSGRALWVAGTEWSKKPENFYGYYNCHGGILSGSHVFGRLMDMAMCGTGTGVLLERELVEALPIVSTKLVLSNVIDSRDIDEGDPATLVVSDPEASTACIVVGDSRKGWVDAYQALIDLAFESSDEEVYVELNLSQVRGKGRKLKGFGGVANPAGLRTAFEKIISLLGGAFGRKLTTVEACLLVDEAASAVVAGNLRRSAGIRLFSSDDDEAKHSKEGLYTQDENGNWRVDPKRESLRLANHTVCYHHRPTLEELKESVRKQFLSGEGAIQFSPEAIARANADLLDSTETKKRFIETYVKEGKDAGKKYLKELADANDVDCDDRQLEHRILRYSANPCAAYESLLLTADGYRKIGELEGQTVQVINAEGDASTGKVWCSGVKQLSDITLSNKEKLRFTSDHVFMTEDGPVEIGKAKGLKLHPFLKKPAHIDQYVCLGFIQGDGILTDALNSTKKGIGICIGSKDEDVSILFESVTGEHAANGPGVQHYTRFFADELERLKFVPACSQERQLPLTYNEWSLDEKAAFLCGIYTANGSVISPSNAGRVSLKSTSRKLIDQVASTLLSDFGIATYVTTNKPTTVKFSNGTYVCRESYDLNIQKFSDRLKFFNSINFAINYKTEALAQNLIDKAPYVSSIKPGKVEPVYDFSEPLTHWGVINGFVVHNCHEIIGNDFMCNLGEVHLNTIDPADKEAQHKAFYATGLMVASLLQHRFPDEEIQYSREQDPIVAVCLSGLFDFFVSALGVEWLDWMVKGRKTGAKYKKFTRLERQYLESWKYSAWEGVAEYCTQAGLKMPNRYTAVQPAGSKSLLTGASPGWHPPKSQRFIRRITFGIDDPLVAALRDYGYNVVPAQSARDEEGNLLNDVNDPRVHEVLVEIPTEVPWANLPGADVYDLSKIPVESQMGLYMQVQRHYSTHTTSATIEFRENEIDTLAELVYKEIQDDSGYIGVAMLARFDANETFPRLPFEPISKETYDRMMAKIKAYRVTLPEDVTILDLLKPYDHPDHVLEPQDTACANAACLAKIDQEEAKGLL